LFDFVAGIATDASWRSTAAQGTARRRGLASRFEKVVATDPSSGQIRHATPRSNIEYRVAPAEASGLPDGSVNLVTAAQSLHWFRAKQFFGEAKRVLVADGAIAVWGYGDPILDTKPLHDTLHGFNRGLLEEYWAPERMLLLNGYRDIPFPFHEVSTPHLELEMHWTLRELAGYLRTWSATARYVEERGTDPVTDVERSLAAGWGDPHAPRLIRWPLYIRAGKL
jgi:hypothetical protein